MRGMDALTGKPLDGFAHIRASIVDILTTPLGSRVMLRDYGSRLPDLVDDPMNELLDVELHAAVAEALDRWEPRFRLTGVWISGRSATGRIRFDVEGLIISDGSSVRLEGITI